MPEPVPFKFIDRRGQPKEERKPPGDPGVILKIRRTGNPGEFLAIFPFNRVREHYFVVNKVEDEGFKLGLHPPEKPTKKQKRAIEAARRKMREVIQEARMFHQADVSLGGPSQVAEPERAQ